jgi:hypothetical protein
MNHIALGMLTAFAIYALSSLALPDAGAIAPDQDNLADWEADEPPPDASAEPD